MSLPRADHGSLKKKADYFFASDAYGRHEVHAFADALTRLGQTVTIGGFLRDLCLGGLRGFKSDVDFVVQGATSSEFESFVAAHGGKLNRFGGSGVRLGRWKVDVWPLERTWAATAGHIEVAKLEDLLDATFFDWDAILYSVADRRLIHAPPYFERLRKRMLDINLEPNPNPLGSAVRALRYASRWQATLSERLAEHVARQIHDHEWDGLVASENRSFAYPVLHMLDPKAILEGVSGFRNGPVTLFSRRQCELPLDDTDRAVGPAQGKPLPQTCGGANGTCSVTVDRSRAAVPRRRQTVGKHTIGAGYGFS